MLSLELEAGRKEAGQFTIKAPVQEAIFTKRINNTIIEFRFDISSCVFSLTGMPAMPMAGDVLGIFPENDPIQILQLKDYLKPSLEQQFFLEGRYETDEGQWYSEKEVLKYLALNPVRIELLLSLYETIQATDEFSEQMERGIPILEQLLSLYQKDPEACKAILKHQHVLDVLCYFPGLLTLQDLCDLQGANYRRVYTISGIERNAYGAPVSVRVLVATGAIYQTAENAFLPNTRHEGCCSGYLKRIAHQVHYAEHIPSVELFIQRRGFGGPEKQRHYLARRPAKPDAIFLQKLGMPLLLIAAGSGISGVKAIVEERLQWKKAGYTVGTASLLFGLQNRTLDFLNEDEWLEYKKEGLIEEIILAESRVAGQNKQYVQDILMNGAFYQELKDLIQGRRALVLCGDRRMGYALMGICLPFLLPLLHAYALPEQLQLKLQQPSKEDLLEVFILGQALVKKLKGHRFILSSTSGSRYPKLKPSTIEAFNQFFETYGWERIMNVLDRRDNLVSF